MYTPVFSKLNIKFVDEFYKELYWEMTNDENLIIDFKNLQYIDLSGLQLLVAAKKTNFNVSFKNFNEELKELIALCGLSDILKDTQ